MNLQEDKLNRTEEIEYLTRYLLNRYKLKPEESFILNINAKWGQGKTYFLKSMQKHLEKKHKVIYFDTWKNDFTKEPLLAFMAQIDDDLKEYQDKSKNAKSIFKVTWKNSLPLILSILAKKGTGFSIEELLEQSKDEETEETDNTTKDEIQNAVSSLVSKATEVALQEHNNLKQSIIEFEKNVSSLLEEIKKKNELPLFILIDELDRCRPNYAIELLENIKHIFDIPKLIFIIATDSEQLSHSINAVYGQNFASEKYLKRFFHQEYTLKEPDRYKYCEYLLEDLKDNEIFFNPLNQNYHPEKNLNVVLFQLLSNSFELSLRDIEQSINMLLNITLTWDKKEKIHLAFILFFIMLKQKKNNLFYTNINDYDYNFFRSMLEQENLHFSTGIQHLNVSLEDILNHYISISKNSRNIDLINKNSILANINAFCLNYREEQLLKNYPNLVINAGQFS